jgi:hypothetical protein
VAARDFGKAVASHRTPIGVCDAREWCGADCV